MFVRRGDRLATILKSASVDADAFRL